MDYPKHLLWFGPIEHQQSLFEKLLHHHEQFQRQTLKVEKPRVTISVRDQAQKLQIEHLRTSIDGCESDLRFAVDASPNAGPVAGLLAAHDLDPSAQWLVTGCDYPLLETMALQQLWSMHTIDSWVTFFQNDEGFYEPLLAIWSSKALQELKRMAYKAMQNARKIGPSSVIRALQNDNAEPNQKQKLICVKPENACWIRNVNTPVEWQEVLPILNAQFHGS